MYLASLHCQLLNRKQTSLSLALIPLDCFVAVTTQDVDIDTSIKTTYPQIYVVYDDVSEIWVNVSQTIQIQGLVPTIKILVGSE